PWDPSLVVTRVCARVTPGGDRCLIPHQPPAITPSTVALCSTPSMLFAGASTARSARPAGIDGALRATHDLGPYVTAGTPPRRLYKARLVADASSVSHHAEGSSPHVDARFDLRLRHVVCHARCVRLRALATHDRHVD